MQQNRLVQLGHILYAFPPFFFIPSVLYKIDQDQVHNMILVVPIWQTLVPQAYTIIDSQSSHHTSYAKSQNEVHPLVKKKTLRAAV